MPLLPVWASVACSRGNFTFTFYRCSPNLYLCLSFLSLFLSLSLMHAQFRKKNLKFTPSKIQDYFIMQVNSVKLSSDMGLRMSE